MHVHNEQAARHKLPPGLDDTRLNTVTPMHVCLVVDDDTIADHLVSALENGGRHRISVFHDIADLQQSNITPDAILIGVQQFAALRENEPMVYLRLSRRSRIVVVLSSRELLDAAHILAFADAWVFQDINSDRINELIDLGPVSYTHLTLPTNSRV